jgi:hypothetical protein
MGETMVSNDPKQMFSLFALWLLFLGAMGIVG